MLYSAFCVTFRAEHVPLLGVFYIYMQIVIFTKRNDVTVTFDTLGEPVSRFAT